MVLGSSGTRDSREGGGFVPVTVGRVGCELLVMVSLAAGAGGLVGTELVTSVGDSEIKLPSERAFAAFSLAQIHRLAGGQCIRPGLFLGALVVLPATDWFQRQGGRPAADG